LESAEIRRNYCRKKYANTARNSPSIPYRAAEHLHVDDVIEPAETRIKLVAALEMLLNNQEEMPKKSTVLSLLRHQNCC